MHRSDRSGDVRAGVKTKTLVVDEKLGLSLEDVERVDVIVVGVRIRPFEAGLELELDQRQLLEPGLDRRDAVLALEPFAFAGRKEDRVRARPAAARPSVDAVEAAGLTAVARPQVLGEAAARRVEVEKTRSATWS